MFVFASVYWAVALLTVVVAIWILVGFWRRERRELDQRQLSIPRHDAAQNQPVAHLHTEFKHS